MEPQNLYDSDYIEELFDHMSSSYDVMNIVWSFGFSTRWRRLVVDKARLAPGQTVCDLMCGAGECWTEIGKKIGSDGKLIAMDISAGMLRLADKQAKKLRTLSLRIEQRNVLASQLEDGPCDAIICAFGVKTLSSHDLVTLAQEVHRILRPGGTFSVVEVSVPKPYFLRMAFMIYLRKVIPVIGKLFVNNNSSYKMLGVYTQMFGDCSIVLEVFRHAGLAAEGFADFFGCATGICGTKN